MALNDPSNTLSFDEQVLARRADQDRTLSAMHGLEEALGAAAPGREAEWQRRVRDALQALEVVLEAEEADSLRPDSLLSDLKRNHPRLRSGVHGVQAQYASLRETLGRLRRELTKDTDPCSDFADVRERLSWLVSALRHQRARENDLLYDAYRDAFGVDVDRDLTGAPTNAPGGDRAGPLNEPQRLTTRRSDRNQSLDALQHVERRAGAASHGREVHWLEELRTSAQRLEETLLRDQEGGADLFADIERSEPRLHNRIVQLHNRYREVAAAVRDIRDRLESTETHGIDVPDLRRTLDQLGTEIRYLRAREADLVYEAYNVDLGSGD